MNVFDYVTSILTTKKQDLTMEEYNPFISNRALSYYPESLMYAQEMNLNNQLDNDLQFQYLINTIHAKKQPKKAWAKKLKNENIDVIQEYYGFNYNKAKVASKILSDEQINEIKKRLEKGGVK